MKKFLNRFLNKKSNFTEDEKLKAMNEQFYYLMTEEKRLLNHIVKANISYFFKYKKMYLAKLLLVIFTYLSIFCGIIFAGLFTLDYFNVISISKAVPKVEPKITIYLPDTDVANIAKLSKQFNVVIFFAPDPKKDWKKYKASVAQIESRGDYKARDGQYWGKYQLGEQARALSGLGKMTFEEFASNPELQEGAFLAWIRFLQQEANRMKLYRYYGKFMDGVQLTESGVVSMSHNAGIGATQQYLARGGGNPPGGTKFLKLGGYDLNLE